MINIKKLDTNEKNIDEKSFNCILIYYIVYVTVKNLGYVKMNDVNPLHLIIDKMNGYIEETNGNKYFTLVGSDESKKH